MLKSAIKYFLIDKRTLYKTKYLSNSIFVRKTFFCTVFVLKNEFLTTKGHSHSTSKPTMWALLKMCNNYIVNFLEWQRKRTLKIKVHKKVKCTVTGMEWQISVINCNGNQIISFKWCQLIEPPHRFGHNWHLHNSVCATFWLKIEYLGINGTGSAYRYRYSDFDRKCEQGLTKREILPLLKWSLVSLQVCRCWSCVSSSQWSTWRKRTTENPSTSRWSSTVRLTYTDTPIPISVQPVREYKFWPHRIGDYWKEYQVIHSNGTHHLIFGPTERFCGFSMAWVELYLSVYSYRILDWQYQCRVCIGVDVGRCEWTINKRNAIAWYIHARGVPFFEYNCNCEPKDEEGSGVVKEGILCLLPHVCKRKYSLW